MTKLTTGNRPQPAGKQSDQLTRHQETQQDTGNSERESTAVKPASTTARLRDLESRLTDKLPIDTQRINEMKNAIASGEYQVDAERIANKMIDFESSLKK
jgi:negative regulator of flagellin synthesis FlgM